jgi:uncharacterized low-complexity protein
MRHRANLPLFFNSEFGVSMNGKKTALSLAIGSAFAVSLAASPIANAAENPFGMSALKSGYMLADASDKKMPEGKCGDMKDAKAKDAKCGGTMKHDAAAGKMKDGQCGNTAKMKEGKCGEGKCGGKKVTKANDGKCGGKMDDKAAPAGAM